MRFSEFGAGYGREATVAPIPNGVIGTYQQLVVNALAQGFLLPPDSANYVMIIVTGGDARFRDDGVDPTAVFGFVIKADQPFLYKGDISAFKIVARTVPVEVCGLFYE